MVYDHDYIFTMEVVVPSLKVAGQHVSTLKDYEAMVIELEDLYEARMDALNRMMARKKKVA